MNINTQLNTNMWAVTKSGTKSVERCQYRAIPMISYILLPVLLNTSETVNTESQ